MQIVIDIDEYNYKLIQDGTYCGILSHEIYNAIKNGIPLPKGNKCRWIHYDYRTICPKEHDVNNPYWMIPENRMDVLKYCPYCGKEIEIEAESEDKE